MGLVWQDGDLFKVVQIIALDLVYRKCPYPISGASSS